LKRLLFPVDVPDDFVISDIDRKAIADDLQAQVDELWLKQRKAKRKR